jgi:hypothetical protein
MISFHKWCETSTVTVNGHSLELLVGVGGQLPFARDRIAGILPDHYASRTRLSELLERLGKPKAAAFIRNKLPTSKTVRSGELGEILATEYIGERTSFRVPIKRLRWKDHRNMAMRGDDLIGIHRNARSRQLRFLKGEIKSRQSFSKLALDAARKALRKDNARPSPHALAFVADRLREGGDSKLADAIDDAQLKLGITLEQVEHFIFAFSGNDAGAFLSRGLESYKGKVKQQHVALRIEQHQEFIQDVYQKVTRGGYHSR